MIRQSLLARLDHRDRQLLEQWVAADASELSRTFWRVITHVGGPVVTIATVLSVLWFGDADVGMKAAAVLAGTHLIAQVLKRFFSRPRPSRVSFEALIAMPSCFSFPSGHAIAASSLAFVFTAEFPALAPFLLPLCTVVAVSRVRLGVHYPGDVLAGQIVALAGTIAVISLW